MDSNGRSSDRGGSSHYCLVRGCGRVRCRVGWDGSTGGLPWPSQPLINSFNGSSVSRSCCKDSNEAGRMGSAALTLIGAIGAERLPELWESHVSSDVSLHAHLEDPEMPP